MFFYLRFNGYISTVIKSITHMNKRNNRRQYVNGYEEKIGYWRYKVNCAIEVGNWEKLEYANKRLVYFLQRQEELRKENGKAEYKIETLYA